MESFRAPGQQRYVTVSSHTDFDTIIRTFEGKGRDGQNMNCLDAAGDYERSVIADFFSSVFSIFFGVPIVANELYNLNISKNIEEDATGYLKEILIGKGRDSIHIGYDGERVDFTILFTPQNTLEIINVATGRTHYVRTPFEQMQEKLSSDIVKAAKSFSKFPSRAVSDLALVLEKKVEEELLESHVFFRNIDSPSFVNAFQLVIEGAPEKHYAAMRTLKRAMIAKSIDDIKTGMTDLETSFNKDDTLRHASLSVTCDKTGDLVLEAHLAYKNGDTNMVTVGTFKDDFYHSILPGAEIPHADDHEIQFAKQVREEINARFPKSVNEWKVQDFFDLYCQHSNNELGTIKPDFHLGLMGSGENYADYEHFPNQPVLVFNKSETEYVIDGPSEFVGNGFDAKVMEGFFELLHQIGEGKKSIHISGHSRGGVEAIAINNLLILLKEKASKNFINEILLKIKAYPGAFLPAHLKGENYWDLIGNAKSKLSNITIGLTLLDPVQGPESPGFNHNAFLLSKSLLLDSSLHKRVDIIMGSRESSQFFFDLHLPRLVQRGSEKVSLLTIHNARCNHGGMDKKLCEGGKTGSVEAHYAACVLTGKPHQIQTWADFKNEHDQCPRRTQDRNVGPFYENRDKVYAAGSMKRWRAVSDASMPPPKTQGQTMSWQDFSQTFGLTHLG